MAREIVELPGQRQVFALLNSRQMLRKLDWELHELRTDPGYPNGQRIAYRAFNCAVTAWQMVDWVWGDLTEAQRGEFGPPNLHKPTPLMDHCKRTNPDLEICESIANASKHRERHRYNSAVECRTVAEVKYGNSAGEPIRSWKWEAVILYHNQEHRALDVFERAHAFWRDFIEQRNLTPE